MYVWEQIVIIQIRLRWKKFIQAWEAIFQIISETIYWGYNEIDKRNCVTIWKRPNWYRHPPFKRSVKPNNKTLKTYCDEYEAEQKKYIWADFEIKSYQSDFDKM
jgi:hypothetical protein